MDFHIIAPHWQWIALACFLSFTAGLLTHRFIMDSLNFSKLDQAIEQALKDVAPDFARANTQAIESEVYFHPRDTKRRNGDTVGSPRDKVDTGELRDSILGPVYDPDGRGFTIGWDAEHAEYVHEGYTTSTGTVVPPARWTEEAMRQYDLLAEFSQSARQRIGV